MDYGVLDFIWVKTSGIVIVRCVVHRFHFCALFPELAPVSNKGCGGENIAESHGSGNA